MLKAKYVTLKTGLYNCQQIFVGYKLQRQGEAICSYML